MRVSVIVCTYNNVPALELALASLLEQRRMPDEIVVADDGSRMDTAAAVRRRAASSPVPILHAWQPDDGFRAAAARNNGIRTSSGDYLIFLDGDCFVHRQFIADHLRAARPGCFLAGTRVNLKPARQRHVLRTGDRRISVLSWGTSKKLNALRWPWLGRLHRHRPGFASANCSAWRDDIYRINGFNEEFQGHGGEDTDFALRLQNAGCERIRLVHAGIAYHLAHPEHPRGDPRAIHHLLEQALHGAIACDHGLSAHPRPVPLAVPLRRAA